MKAVRGVFMIMCLALGVLIISCAPYDITKKLEKPISYSSICTIGAITDELPSMDPEKKPTLEDIIAFKKSLYNALNEYKCMQILDIGENNSEYEVNGGIFDFARGSGTLRFIFGSLAGNAKLVMNLQLVDKTNNEVVFGGRFWAEVTGGDWITSGSTMFERVADNFAKSLQKQAKKLAKDSEKDED